METKNINKKKVMKIVIFAIVLLIPIIYSFFYLKSYWDPYNNLTGMKIAIVNLDEGEKEENQGKEFVKSLKDSGTFTICEETLDKANVGMQNGEYYATILIPSNFTKCLNSAGETDKQIATITYSPNQATNYLATQIINSAMKTIETNLQAKINSKVAENLSDKLKEVPESLQEISDGAEQILEGSQNLSTGIGQINEGTNKLNNSYTEFNNGINSAYEGSKSVDNGLEQVNSGTSTLQIGSKSLNEAITQINSGVDELSKQGNEGIKSLSQGINAVNQGAEALNTGVSNYADGATQLAQGTNQYVEGTKTLANGTKQYVQGTNQLVQNVNSYIDGVDKVNAGAKQILTGLANSGVLASSPELAQQVSTLQSAMTQIENSGKQIKEGETKLTSNNETLINGANQLMSKSETLENGANSIISNAKNVKAGANNLATGTKQLEQGASGLSKITSGIGSLKDALTQVQTGTKNLENGVNSLNTGTNTLKNGTNSLTNGLSKLNNSSVEVKTALNKLSEGTNSAYNGSTQLVEGVETFNNEINKGIEDSNTELKKLDGIEKFTEDPIEFKTEAYGDVSSYGVAFTPLFLSIGLWVGGLMAYVVLYYDQKHRFWIFGSQNKNKLLQNVMYILVGAIEGVITAILLKVGLGFEIQNMALYLFASAVSGMAFISIIQCLIRNFDDVGKFITLIILVLQLAASGGTFPVETIDSSFQGLTAFLPMTYSIKLLREILVPTVTNFKGIYIGILIGITIICLAITTVVDIIRKKKRDEHREAMKISK